MPDRLSAQSVALIIKRHAAAVGLDIEDFAGHSLRPGFITTAYSKRAKLLSIMGRVPPCRYQTVEGLRAATASLRGSRRDRVLVKRREGVW